MDGGTSTSSAATERVNWGVLGAVLGCLLVCRAGRGHTMPMASQQIPAGHKQIGQRAGYEQAMGVLLQPAIAHLGKAEHPLDDPDRMFDPGAYLGLGTVFARSTSSTTPRWR